MRTPTDKEFYKILLFEIFNIIYDSINAEINLHINNFLPIFKNGGLAKAKEDNELVKINNNLIPKEILNNLKYNNKLDIKICHPKDWDMSDNNLIKDKKCLK